MREYPDSAKRFAPLHSGPRLASDDGEATIIIAPDLSTTNALLAIMAAVSLLEGLALIGLFVGGFILYRRVARMIAGIEERHVAPMAARVNSILDDVKGVTTVVHGAASSADAGVRWGLAWLLRQFRQGRQAA